MPDDATQKERAYSASAWLASLGDDLDNRGLLQGEVREPLASSLELFRQQGPGHPPEDWHVGLIDLYEELHGHPPEAN